MFTSRRKIWEDILLKLLHTWAAVKVILFTLSFLRKESVSPVTAARTVTVT